MHWILGLFAVCFFAACELIKYLASSPLPGQRVPRNATYEELICAPANAIRAPATPSRPALAPTLKVGPVITHDFRVADEIHHVVFDSVWRVTARVYEEGKRVAHSLRCTDVEIASLLKSSHHRTVFGLGEIPFEQCDLQQALRQAEADGVKMINELLSALQPPVAPAVQPLPAAQSAQRFEPIGMTPQGRDVLARQPSGEESAEVGAAASNALVATSRTYTATGTVAMIGETASAVGSGKTFQVKLATSSGGESSFRGVDLAKQCERLGIKLGDKIKIESRVNPSAQSGDTFAPKKLFTVEVV